jgi:Protein of unknown function (DUF2656)
MVQTFMSAIDVLTNTNLTNTNLGRMLLSHNFDLSPDIVPALSREEFAEVFRHDSAWQSRLLDHPHWIVELLYPIAEFSPAQIGDRCAQALANRRNPQRSSILILGGLKTTPPTSSSPDALQPGEWGVDVVETPSGEAFLSALNWDATIAGKPTDQIFKIEKEP